MQRNLIIGSVAAGALFVLALGSYFFFLNGGDSLALARLDQLVRTYDGEYESASFDTATDRLIVDGLVLRNFTTDPDSEPLDLIQIGHLDARGIARASLAEAISTGRPVTLFTAFEATDLAFTENGQMIRAATLSMRDVSFDASGMTNTRSEDLSPGQAFAQMLLMLNAAEIRVSGFQSPDEGLTGMRVGELSLGGISGGTVDTIAASEISLWDNGQVGTVGDTINLHSGSVQLSALDARAPLGRIFRGARINFDRQSDIPTFARFGAADITVEDETGGALTVSSFSIENDAYNGAMPTKSVLSVEAIGVPLDGGFVDREQVQALRDLNYDELVFSFVYDYSFDLDRQVFDLNGLTIGVQDMGELRMNLQLSDIPLTEDMIDQTSDALLADGFVSSVLENASIVSGTLVLENNGLFERLVDLNAVQAGVSREVYMATALDDLRTQRQEVASSPLAVQTFDALITFFENPDSVSLTVSPDAPVPMLQMAVAVQINPVLLVEMLNLQVTAGD